MLIIIVINIDICRYTNFESPFLECNVIFYTKFKQVSLKNCF